MCLLLVFDMNDECTHQFASLLALIESFSNSRRVDDLKTQEQQINRLAKALHNQGSDMRASVKDAVS